MPTTCACARRNHPPTSRSIQLVNSSIVPTFSWVLSECPAVDEAVLLAESAGDESHRAFISG
jgi:hypothetical protein